ncbi:MAG: RsmD family RNA methyltransferase [Proteobacteria bacterium]|nr:RsmD family RNA methyltransferase [Pseudomonadota bacterium]
MRIVGGKLRGRRIRQPSGSPARPTTERAREGVASALDARGALADAYVLELFAGTGALSFEALSRGASAALLVELDARMRRLIRRTAHELGLATLIRLLALDLLGPADRVAARIGAVAQRPFDLVFVDAPYARQGSVAALLEALAAGKTLASSATVVIEYSRRGSLKLVNFVTLASYRYGDTSVLFARPPGASATKR